MISSWFDKFIYPCSTDKEQCDAVVTKLQATTRAIVRTNSAQYKKYSA